MSKFTNDGLTQSSTGCFIASCTHMATVSVKRVNTGMYVYNAQTSASLSICLRCFANTFTGSTSSKPPKLRRMACWSSHQVGVLLDWLAKPNTIFTRLQHITTPSTNDRETNMTQQCHSITDLHITYALVSTAAVRQHENQETEIR